MMPNGRANGVPEAQDDRDDRVALGVPNNEAAPNGQDDGDRIFGTANEAGGDKNGELGVPNLGLPNGYHHEDDEDEVPEDPDNWEEGSSSSSEVWRVDGHDSPEGPHHPVLGLGARPLTRREDMLLFLRLNALERALEAEDEDEFDEDEEVAPLLGPNADFRSVRPQLGCVVCGVNGHRTCDCEVHLEFRDRVRIVFAYRLCGRCAEFHDRRVCINHLRCARCRREDSHPTFLCWRPIPNE
ncbi:unnamed protein product [Cylicocyclus nassatus]|uniref:Uncharacterized protein n=1 Tax=Cylicocyclus nassatus TaxID=53992 RepID=A0AA36HGN3_CYLNA|nr:unnamed protein product [Cylicocyclus nassatus]